MKAAEPRVVSPRSRPARPALLVVLAAFVAGLALAEEPEFPPWAAQEEKILDALRNGEVLHAEPIGHGVTQPFRVELSHDGFRIDAVWKPIDASAFKRTESYAAEAAAYRLSRLLDLDRVPPTVVRKLRGSHGSLQYWVHSSKVYKDWPAPPRTLDFTYDAARMRMFDRLICNPDRNSGNFMVDHGGHIVLIDHSRALSYDAHSRAAKKVTPALFDGPLVDRLRTLELGDLEEALEGLVARHRMKALLKERDRLIADVDRQIARRGAAILFE